MLLIKKVMPKIVKLASNGFSVEEIALHVATLLKVGKVAALPTDTVYGIAAMVQNKDAVKALYKIKARDFKKPIAICVGEISDIPKWGKITFPWDLLKDLLPGPVTIVLERELALNPELNPGVPLIGIRIPDNRFIRNVCRLCNSPLALTSANVSSFSSSLSIEEFKNIWPHLDLIVDGGILGYVETQRLGSTVVDLSVRGFYRIIRDGCSRDNTEEVLQRHHLKELGLNYMRSPSL